MRIKKTITMNGEIIPTILTSITKAQANEASKAFLYEGLSKKFIVK